MKNANLTNEDLRKEFSDNFKMTNFAILVAREYVKEHESGSLKDILREVKEKSQEHTA